MALFTIKMAETTPFMLFENTLPDQRSETAWLFTQPIKEIIATRHDQLENVLAEVDIERKKGHYLAGFLSYEAAYAFSSKLTGFDNPATTERPLLQFYVFDQVLRPTPDELDQSFQQFPESVPFIKNWTPTETESAYISKLNRLRHYIEQGDVYQVNHTFRADFELEGDINGLYQALRKAQPVAFSALLHLPHNSVLSLSPELFLNKQGNTLSTKPMKGTAARGKNKEEDQQILAAMRKDKKLHSENLMIVDLMRNDIGRLAKPGSVEVSDLFEVQTYKTLHQMISTIKGEIAQDTPFAQIIKQLFPCGSITGAPKIRSMEIINELENTPRHIYTGAIGFITPENDFTFNVPIRTLYFPKGDTHGTMGIGGGIIYESNPQSEWQEALLKARFLTGLNRNFKLIETFRYDAAMDEISRLDAHLNRLQNSAEQFTYPVEPEKWQQTIQAYLEKQSKDSDLKIRFLLDAAGNISLSSEKLEQENDDILPTVTLSKHRIDADNIFRQHKTTNRELYNRAYQQAEQQGFYDVLFLNEAGFIAEASRHNLILEKDGQLYTPPTSDGALPGVMRQHLQHVLKNTGTPIQEKQLTLEDLHNAERLYLCNSVRGMIEVSLDTDTAHR
uniref:Para-aminobenzoate synthase, aminase component ) n=1 Tax=uncultured Thiotrichaceae bacterium TaxID=298394 RepID=A0A6S6TYN6_9GAMM|nr:MAG: Para-aminobenzoate synthase, aminase component (EC / Aminodeoxychorismate lyase (EC [uncultured Thiotrichaceae bacterium]